jgi:hypothetical protein
MSRHITYIDGKDTASLMAGLFNSECEDPYSAPYCIGLVLLGMLIHFTLFIALLRLENLQKTPEPSLLLNAAIAFFLPLLPIADALGRLYYSFVSARRTGLLAHWR